MLKVLYFAWVREKAGIGEETVEPPGDAVADVAGLIAWLKTRGGGPAEALADMQAIRVAVNHEHVSVEHRLQPGDEVAFFPPVTGGSTGG